MRSRYFGPARPVEEKKDWMLDGYAADSWARDQSKPPPIYLRPRDPDPIPPDPEPITLFYEYIDSQGYPYDLVTGKEKVDMQANPEEKFYDLQGPIVYSYRYIDQQGYPYDLQAGSAEIDLEITQANIIYDLNG